MKLFRVLLGIEKEAIDDQQLKLCVLRGLRGKNERSARFPFSGIQHSTIPYTTAALAEVQPVVAGMRPNFVLSSLSSIR
jgi:hypothetical protein